MRSTALSVSPSSDWRSSLAFVPRRLGGLRISNEWLPSLLLLFTFLVGAGAALMAPSWQAVVPQLVPKHDLAGAVAANSIGFNVSRAVGPALGGATIATLGIAAPFWIDAVSDLAIVGAVRF
jgi:MFS family permease